ncbi:plasmid stabilization protein [Halorubrum sp. BOL3-1]|uniref:plastocyanin/azurin family copper-binding protein n=1 Tax=Halorubrum sp. BOL3-1 TaxID=2497325 RepID=UPI001005226E|nr:plastocyanin/azurin family copper-binding protein [Halorubrum sp. BOL3-1]QAU11909.1 plasmid stabilization protein [Halorubrum sp. BOL3-1]
MTRNIRDTDRRRLLQVLGAGATVGLAGCGSSDDGDDGTDGSDGDDGTDGSDGGDGTDDADESVPGADVLGGPDDLQGSATVEALSLDADRGAGQNVFSPAVAWVEEGATVTWEIASGSHSVTAYHPETDAVLRIPEEAEPFDSGTVSEGTFEHTFETPGVYDYYCRPHRGLGMVGLVVVGEATAGPGTAPIEDLDSAESNGLADLLELAGVEVEAPTATYGWTDGTWDSYWYSLYNMSTTITLSGNGVLFPANDQQRDQFEQRFPAIVEAADADRPPVIEPNLNMAPFTEGDPHFTEQPVFDGDSGRPDARTLTWDRSRSSMTVSPSSLGWTHLKGITWAKNFEDHAEILPPALAPLFRAMVLSTMAQVGTVFGLVSEQGGGNFRLNDENLLLGSAFRPGEGLVDETPRPRHHSAMLWFLSNLNSFAQGGWFGYENPEPLIPAENVQALTNGMGKTTMNAVDPADVENTRLAGELLGAIGWFGTQTNQDQLRSAAADYADGLAGRIESNLDGNGRVDNGADNQAATQGIVGQGLLWASQIDGVDHADTADDVLGYLTEELYDDEAGTFASGSDDSTYTITARDAGDITGGLNAADVLLDRPEVQSQYASFFNQTFNRGRLQRAERPNSRDENAEFTLPLPPMAGGDFGQAAVYNREVAYDTESDEWSVTDDTFDTEMALYLSNQEIWISQWSGEFYDGRGVPGQTNTPE